MAHHNVKTISVGRWMRMSRCTKIIIADSVHTSAKEFACGSPHVRSACESSPVKRVLLTVVFSVLISSHYFGTGEAKQMMEIQLKILNTHSYLLNEHLRYKKKDTKLQKHDILHICHYYCTSKLHCKHYAVHLIGQEHFNMWTGREKN